ncbi:MAG: kynureninase [Bacteroidia bacterium]
MDQIKNITDYENTLAFAKHQDAIDPLKKYRENFYMPMMNGKPVIYFTGNSLGLQPKSTQDLILNILEDWASYGVEAYFHGKNPWLSYHEQFFIPISKIVGSKPSEVTVLNQLTINLHLLLVSFYKPTKTRFKIICEGKAFPSDQYAMQSQVKFHGFNPDEAIIEIMPREEEHCLRTEDILKAIEQNKESLALVLFGGINYYTGEVMDMKNITEAAHQAGAKAGFDLAHAVGNIKLHLHDWNVDFACWCSYKYLNSGPGGISGIYIHETHLEDKTIPRFEGWWGNDKANRFKMEKQFTATSTAESWQLSTAPPTLLAAHKAAIDLFDEVGMDKLMVKAENLTGYLEFVIDEINESLTHNKLEIITPRNKKQRGCQLSIIAHNSGKNLFNKLLEEGIIADWREPNVIRCAPVPFYNTFEDIYTFGEILKKNLTN